MSTTHEIVVIGGGLAGSFAALALANAGRTVVLLEKSSGPHDKVCGEFLSTEALHYLRRSGIDPGALGSVPIRRLRLAGRRSLSEAELPFPAQSLSRACLDEALLQAASAAGVEVRRGVHVSGLARENGGWNIAVREGESLGADDVFLATGKHDLRTAPRPAGSHAGLVGFKMYYRLTQQQATALGDTVELALFPGGYAGLQPVEGGRVNLSLLINASMLKVCGGRWAALQHHIVDHSPHLAERLQHATPLLDAPLTIASIPYGHVQGETEARLWRLGDQAAVIPSFSGDGMSIALHSAALAADSYLRGQTSVEFQRRLALQMRYRVRLATLLSRLLVDHPWAVSFTHAWPGVLPRVASMTRIPSRRLLH